MRRAAAVVARVLFIIGCGLFVLGGGVYALTRPYLSDTVERLDLAGVTALLSVVTGEELPARFGLVRYRTAAQYNDGEHAVGWPFVLAGSLVAGIGLLALVLYFSTAASRAP